MATIQVKKQHNLDAWDVRKETEKLADKCQRKFLSLM
jgi:hypothetical protein